MVSSRKAKRLRTLFLVFFSFLFISGKAAAAEKPFKVVGYIPDYDIGHLATTVDFNQFTDINYFSLIPQKDGEVIFTQNGNEAELRKLVKEAHKHDVNVGISVGGWGLSDFFDAATSEQNRSFLIKNILDYVTTYQLDTVDIDWEYPAEEKASQFDLFIQELKAELGDVSLSICVPTGVASNGEKTGNWEKHFPATALRQADWINIMAYDAQVAGHPHHSPVELQKNSLVYWNNVMGGDQLDKLVAGVPFYSKAESGAVMTYNKLVASVPKMASADEVTIDDTIFYFNNKATIQQKVLDTIALGARGVMVWTPTQDTELGSPQRLMDVMLATVAKSSVSLDKRPTSSDSEPLITNKRTRKKLVVGLVSAILVVLSSQLFQGRWLFFVPKELKGKRIKRENMAKLFSFLGFILAALLLLSLVLPLTLLIAVVVLLTGIGYWLARH